MSNSNLVKTAFQRMKENGILNMLQAKYVKAVSKIIDDNSISPLQSIKEIPSDDSYLFASSIVMKYLVDYSMNETIQAINYDSQQFIEYENLEGEIESSLRIPSENQFRFIVQSRLDHGEKMHSDALFKKTKKPKPVIKKEDFQKEKDVCRKPPSPIQNPDDVNPIRKLTASDQPSKSNLVSKTSRSNYDSDHADALKSNFYTAYKGSEVSSSLFSSKQNQNSDFDSLEEIQSASETNRLAPSSFKFSSSEIPAVSSTGQSADLYEVDLSELSD